MPWRIQRRDGKHCVVKSDTGETVKCHDSRVKAIKHQRALYAGESRSTMASAWVTEPSGVRNTGVSEQSSQVHSSADYTTPVVLPGQKDTTGAQAVIRGNRKNNSIEGEQGLAPERSPDAVPVTQARSGARVTSGATESPQNITTPSTQPRMEDVRFAVESRKSSALTTTTSQGEFADSSANKTTSRSVPLEIARNILREQLRILSAPGQTDSALYANEPSMSASILSDMEEPDAITAAVSPLKPPRSWFETPEPNVPTPLTFTPEGQVHGHLALWNSCHTGFLNGAFSECVKAPRSQTEYQLFHVGEIETEEGDLVPIGKLTFDTSHAPLTAGLQAASRHYDETGSVGAFVRARDGQHGVWLSGAVRSDLSPEGLRDLRANPPSGDWRALNHNLELIASLAVPVPGFPIPRAQLALAASANGEQEVSALILPGVTEPEPDRGMIRHKAVLRTRTREALAAAVLTAKERRSLPRKR